MGGRTLPPNSPKWKKAIPQIFPQNKIWGIWLKSRWLRTVKNNCKASKIHSSGDMQPGHKKVKVRKTDGWKLGKSSPQDADEPYVGSYATLLSEPSLKGEGKVSNSRMN